MEGEEKERLVTHEKPRSSISLNASALIRLSSWTTAFPNPGTSPPRTSERRSESLSISFACMSMDRRAISTPGDWFPLQWRAARGWYEGNATECACRITVPSFGEVGTNSKQEKRREIDLSRRISTHRHQNNDQKGFSGGPNLKIQETIILETSKLPYKDDIQYTLCYFQFVITRVTASALTRTTALRSTSPRYCIMPVL